MIKFCYFNLITQDATDITASTEDAFFPASNLKSHLSTKVWRSTAASGNVVFDFKTIEAVDSILIKPSLDGFGFTGDLTIEANATDSWGAPAYSTTITVDTTYSMGIKLLTSAESYRFWRVSGTGATYIELSNIFIGSKFEPGKNITFNWTYDYKDHSKVSTTRYRQQYIDEIVNQKIINGQIQYLTSVEMDTFTDFTDLVGVRKPFWIILDDDEEFSPSKYLFAGQFFFRARPSLSNVAFGYYNTKLGMVECI